MRTNTTRFVAVTAIALALGGTALGTAAGAPTPAPCRRTARRLP